MDKTASSPQRDKAATLLLLEQKAKLQQNILENDEKTRVYLHNKLEKSSPIFANTKVTSCSSVLMSNGLSVAMPFRSGSNVRTQNRKTEKFISLTQ